MIHGRHRKALPSQRARESFPKSSQYRGMLLAARKDRAAIENFEHNRCVDLFSRPDGSCGFEEFRRDVEDRGEWTPIQYFSDSVYASREAALAAAMQSIAWLPDAIRQSPSAQKLLSGHRG
jgi:DNA-binding transcriptional LysR family regulator